MDILNQQIVFWQEILPYGKHSFYIAISYIIGFISLLVLIMRSKSLNTKIKQQLRIKYSREN